jgi:hypothetical protein
MHTLIQIPLLYYDLKWQIIGEMRSGMPQSKKRIYNPLTGKYYELRQRSSKYGDSGEIKGLWSSKKKKKI